MTTGNRRNKANTGLTERNSDQLLDSALVDKAKREESILPNSPHYTHIPKIEGVVSDYNIQEATKAVVRNKGAPGVDGITTEEITDVLKKEWPKIKQDILNGIYRPNPVKRVEIPKPDGSGVRKLGIPTVMDRIIQQAIYQEIVYTFEPTFSDNSYGFRLGRRAQQAVLSLQLLCQNEFFWITSETEAVLEKISLGRASLGESHI